MKLEGITMTQIRLFIAIWKNDYIITANWDVFKDTIEAELEPLLLDCQVVEVGLPTTITIPQGTKEKT